MDGEVATQIPSVAPTQAEADALIATRKWVVNAAQIVLPARGGHIGFELESPDADETFMLDIRRARRSRRGQFSCA